MKNFISLMFVLAAAVITGCGHRNSNEETEPTVPARVPVQLGVVKSGNVRDAVRATGTTDVLRKEKVVTPVAGIVLSLNVLEGTAVHAGDILAVLRTRESQAAIEGARILAGSSSSDRQKREAERALRLADTLQSTVTVRAHFDGVVATRSVMQGEFVAEQAELVTLIDPTSVDFIMQVPLVSMQRIRPGLEARVHFPAVPTQTFPAFVDAVSPQTDAQTQSVRVRLRFHNLATAQQAILKTDMLGEGEIITAVRNGVLLVPRKALLRDDETNSYSVVVMTPDSLARSVRVNVGVVTDSTAEVTAASLRAGMNVIVTGHYGLADSTRVVVEHP